MRLGIMQPYFFPHLAHFALIANTDAWVIFDTAQYTPKSWMNRNRVLRPDHGWMYVTVPLEAATQNMRIFEARVLDRSSTHRSLVGKLSHYRRRAPHFDSVVELVGAVFDDMKGDSLVELNICGLREVCDYLGMPFAYRVASEMQLPLAPIRHAGGWAPAIASALGADEYINPLGGRFLFDPEEFSAAGVTLKFLDMPEFRYPTPGYDFEPGLSILDVLMWNDPPRVREALKSVVLTPSGIG